jgi:hypothetical protein
MLKERFTQRAKQRLQALCVLFNNLEVKVAINETPIKFWDRYTDLLTAIGNIDEAEISTDDQKLAVLKNAVKVAYPFLWTIMNTSPDLTEERAREMILGWEQPGVAGASSEKTKAQNPQSQSIKDHVANYLALGDVQKKAYHKNQKHGHTKDKREFKIICWNCQRSGHTKRECRSPYRAPEEARDKRESAISENEESEGDEGRSDRSNKSPKSKAKHFKKHRRKEKSYESEEEQSDNGRGRSDTDDGHSDGGANYKRGRREDSDDDNNKSPRKSFPLKSALKEGKERHERGSSSKPSSKFMTRTVVS